MGDQLSTTIASPVTVVAGGIVSGDVEVTSPGAGNFYLLMEQYTAELAFIPGSRAYLYQAGTGPFVNNTSLSTTRTRAGIVVEDITIELTVPNTDCLLYLFLKRRPSNVIAGAFATGTTYQIMSVGTTDFTLIGAASNSVGVVFVATGAGAGTGTAAQPPDPDTDDTIDYIVLALQAAAAVVPTTGLAATGLDISSIINLMITMMIIVMIMKMMTGAMEGIAK